jgi:hypothetical protein
MRRLVLGSERTQCSAFGSAEIQIEDNSLSALDGMQPAPRAFDPSGTALHVDGETVIKERLWLAAIMHDVAHISGLLSERALAVRPAGSV